MDVLARFWIFCYGFGAQYSLVRVLGVAVNWQPPYFVHGKFKVDPNMDPVASSMAIALKGYENSLAGTSGRPLILYFMV